MYYSLGEYNQAKDLHEKALTIRKKIFGEDHADLASSYNNLVLVNNRLGEYNQAKELHEECGFPLAEERKKRKRFFSTHGWEYGFECAGGLQVTWRFRVQFFLLPSAIA